MEGKVGGTLDKLPNHPRGMLSVKKMDLIAVNNAAMNDLLPQVSPCNSIVRSDFLLREMATAMLRTEGTAEGAKKRGGRGVCHMGI